MRLISQNGKIDVPYEKVILGICDQNNGQEYVIYAYHDSPRPLFIATYSTKAKALKVMEMLRNSYCGLPIIMRNVDISDEVIKMFTDLKKNGVVFQKLDEKPSVEYVNNTYFKFPKDEDVEV